MPAPLPAPQRTAEREALAKAITHLGGLDRQLERLGEARSRIDRHGREDALAVARRGLDEARQRAPALLVAKAMGEPYDPASTASCPRRQHPANDPILPTLAIPVLSQNFVFGRQPRRP